jgi:hypothetical protein
LEPSVSVSWNHIVGNEDKKLDLMSQEAVTRSYEKRMKAVQLYIKYDLSAIDIIRELGYLHYNTLVMWYKEYVENGNLHKNVRRSPGLRGSKGEKRSSITSSTGAALEG